MYIFPNNAVRLFRGECDIARYLGVSVCYSLAAKAERRGIGVAGLLLELRPINGATIEPRRGASFQPAAAKAEIF